MVFSSYSLMDNGGKGFPDGKSDCKKCKTEKCRNECIKSVPFQKAYNPLSVGYDSGDEIDWKEGTYTRVHRNIDIVNAMREWMGFENLTENELYEKERLKADCNESCLICNEESKKLNKCIYCNTEKGYYPIFYGDIYERYHECIHNESNTERLYFDYEDNYFKPCYETCKTCIKGGDEKNHNCLSCDINYIFRPEELNTNNCVLNCTNPYYFNLFGQYKCSETPSCPKEAKYLIKNKNKCINDCKNDDIYKYEYKGNCLNDCPEKTYKDNYECKDIYIEPETYISTTINIPSNTILFYEIISTSFIDNILTDVITNENKNIIKDENCSLSEYNIDLYNFNFNSSIDSIVKRYSEDYKYVENHISQFKNNQFSIILYKNPKCINDLNLTFPNIDFGNCYSKTQNFYSINNSLIIATMDEYVNDNPITTNSFFDPNTGKRLDGENICKEEHIIIEEDLSSFIKKDKNYELMICLTKQGINVFDSSDNFYTNICYDYDSPVNKDITLKDRLLTFFPNITLCDPGCENNGVHLDTMTSICKCKFIDIINSRYIKDNIIFSKVGEEIYDFISSTNLEVLKCYKYIFKHFFELFGGYIVIILLIIHIILSILYFIFNSAKIKKYIYSLTENYIEYLLDKKNKKKENKENNNDKKENKDERENKENKENKEKRSKKENKEKEENKDDNKKKDKKEKEKEKKKSKSLFLLDGQNANNTKKKYILTTHNKFSPSGQKLIIEKKYSKERVSSISKINLDSKDIFKDKLHVSKNSNKISLKEKQNNEDNKINFKEYLETSFNEMDYDDAIKKDKRKFFSSFCESIKENQIILVTFFSENPLKPKTIKLMLFNLNILLYLVINGLFFNEDYISKVYHLDKKDNFLSFFPRSINRLAYTTISSLIINFIVDCFEIDEKKLKGIFIREKKDIINLKFEVFLLIKKIMQRYLAFIIVCFILLIISLYYLLCFNYVYPHAQIEWIKSTILIIIIVQIISFISCFLETTLRYISFYFKSEKIYKYSKLLN